MRDFYLRNLGVPIDLKLPEAAQLLLYSVVVHKSPSNCVSVNFAIVFVGAFFIPR